MAKWLVSFILVKKDSMLSEVDIEAALRNFLTREFSNPQGSKAKVEAIIVKEVPEKVSEDFVQDVDSGNIYVIRDSEIVRLGAG